MIKNIIKNFKELSTNEIFLLLFPLLIVTGPFLPDLVVSYFFILYSYYLIKNENYKNILLDYKYFIFFGFVCFVSTFINYKLDILTLKSLLLFRFYFFICISLLIIEFSKKFLNLFFIILLTTLVIISIDAYFQLLTNYNFFGLEKIDPKRLSGMFGDEYILGTFLLRTSILLLYLSIYSKINHNLILVFFLFIIEPLIFFSGQRGPFIISIIFVLGILLVNYKNWLMHLGLIYLILVIVGNLYFNQKYNERFIYDISENLKKENVININEKEKKLTFSILSPSHTKIYVSSLQMFKEKKLLGHGVNSFRKVCLKFNGCSTHPHNFYLQVLAELGLIGFLFLLVFFIRIFYDFSMKLKLILYDKKSELKNSYYLSLGMFLIFFPLQPNGNLFNNYMMTNLSLIIIFYLYDKRRLNE